MSGPDDDNPFAEPDDDDRTMILPRAALAGHAAQSSSPPAPEPQAATGGRFEDLPHLGRSPIIAHAAPLLLLLARMRNVVSVPDPGPLRERTVLDIRRYEQALRDARLPIEQIRTSHYALCASLDDVVQNSPWGSRGAWANASLVSTFHGEVKSGERFFELLTRLTQNAGRYLPVIELMYLCLSLGMQGRYRLSPRGPAELDRLREEIYLIIIRQRGLAEPALSPHWRGIAAPYRPLRSALPVWLAALVGAGLVGLAYGLVLLGLARSSDRVFDLGLALPPTTTPHIVRAQPPRPVPPAPQPGQRDTLAGFLAPEIRQGLVSVVGTEAVPIVRIQSAGLFRSGSATLEANELPVLERVGHALQGRAGPVQVVGYTDNEPIHTVAFPSNFQLSLARARSAVSVLARSIDPGRLSAEGRADADPVAPNETEAGRAKNRRIEIVVGGGA